MCGSQRGREEGPRLVWRAQAARKKKRVRAGQRALTVPLACFSLHPARAFPSPSFSSPWGAFLGGGKGERDSGLIPIAAERRAKRAPAGRAATRERERVPAPAPAPAAALVFFRRPRCAAQGLSAPHSGSADREARERRPGVSTFPGGSLMGRHDPKPAQRGPRLGSRTIAPCAGRLAARGQARQAWPAAAHPPGIWFLAMRTAAWACVRASCPSHALPSPSLL